MQTSSTPSQPPRPRWTPSTNTTSSQRRSEEGSPGAKSSNKGNLDPCMSSLSNSNFVCSVQTFSSQGDPREPSRLDVFSVWKVLRVIELSIKSFTAWPASGRSRFRVVASVRSCRVSIWLVDYLRRAFLPVSSLLLLCTSTSANTQCVISLCLSVLACLRCCSCGYSGHQDVEPGHFQQLFKARQVLSEQAPNVAMKLDVP